MLRLLPLLILALGGCKQDATATRAIGARCMGDEDCEQRCLPAPRWPSGFCSTACAAPTDCPPGTECVVTADDGQVCLFACFDDGDCSFLEGLRGDWKCREIDGEQVCAP